MFSLVDTTQNRASKVSRRIRAQYELQRAWVCAEVLLILQAIHILQNETFLDHALVRINDGRARPVSNDLLFSPLHRRYTCTLV